MTTFDAPETRVWTALRDELDAGRRPALVAVAESRGSSPGRVGWVMAVGASGWLAGTVGGGPAEDRVVAAARDAVGGGLPRLVKQVHRPGVPEASGLVCGGEQRVVIAGLGVADRAGVASLIAALAGGDRIGWMIDAQGWQVRDEPVTREPGLVVGPVEWRFTWVSGPEYTVHLVGGGQVGAALADLLVGLAFRVTVVDERPGVGAAFEGRVHRTSAVPYEELADEIAPGDRELVVIATHAPERDAVALAALAGTEVGYLGLLGSPAKVAALLPGPTRPPWLSAPAGLRIGSRTPAEIAVSIAAELVALRAGDRARRSVHA